jgi:hypothetical protein
MIQRDAGDGTYLGYDECDNLPSVPTVPVKDNALYEAMIDHDTYREQTGEDA